MFDDRLFWWLDFDVRVDERNNSIINQDQSPCNVRDGASVAQGVCKSRTECLLTGGRPKGFCGLLNACCLYSKGCGKSTGAKVSYFTDEDYTDQTECTLKVKLLNPRICQLRVDFYTFHLEPPTPTPATNNMSVCRDRFEIKPNYNGLPTICGTNDGQHVYVELNGTNDKVAELSFFLRARVSGEDRPRWNIKVTQLECAGGPRNFLLDKKNGLAAAKDFHLIAPPFVVQYFIEPVGFVSSFNYQRNIPYTNGQKYAIAFKRRKSDCGIRFTVDYLKLHQNPNPLWCIHYIFIPGLNFRIGGDRNYTVCAETKDTVLTATPPGPFYIYVDTTSNFMERNENDAGFKLRYETFTC